jgi:hypothetical protein
MSNPIQVLQYWKGIENYYIKVKLGENMVK